MQTFSLSLDIASFDWFIALLIFVATFAIEILYVYYTLRVVSSQPLGASFASVSINLLGAFGVISYVNNPLYLIPYTLGAFIGTYFAIKFEFGKHHPLSHKKKATN